MSTIKCSVCEDFINTDENDEGEYDGSSTGYTCIECLKGDLVTNNPVLVALQHVIKAVTDNLEKMPLSGTKSR